VVTVPTMSVVPPMLAMGSLGADPSIQIDFNGNSRHIHEQVDPESQRERQMAPPTRILKLVEVHLDPNACTCIVDAIKIINHISALRAI
jgi:hypothetical protein